MESGTDDYKVRFVLVQFKIVSYHPFTNVPHTAFHSKLHLLDVIQTGRFWMSFKLVDLKVIYNWVSSAYRWYDSP